MSGDNIVIDTSLIINMFNGDENVLPLITGRNLYLSVISEIEVLSFPGLSAEDKILINDFLSKCYLVDLDFHVKEIAITVRASHKTKLPDAVIAATAIYYDLPLFTMDKGFQKINDLKAIILK